MPHKKVYERNILTSSKRYQYYNSGNTKEDNRRTSRIECKNPIIALIHITIFSCKGKHKMQKVYCWQQKFDQQMNAIAWKRCLLL